MNLPFLIHRLTRILEQTGSNYSVRIRMANILQIEGNERVQGLPSAIRSCLLCRGIHPDTHRLMLPQIYGNKRDTARVCTCWCGHAFTRGEGTRWDMGSIRRSRWCHFLFGHATIGSPVQWSPRLSLYKSSFDVDKWLAVGNVLISGSFFPRVGKARIDIRLTLHPRTIPVCVNTDFAHWP